jgi:hypothetical protein
MQIQSVNKKNVQTDTVNYRLIKKIKDEKFDEENLHHYRLLLNIGIRDFQVLVVSDTNWVLLLEDYVLPEVSSPEALQETLTEIFDAHAVLKAGFWKNVTVSFKTQKFVQVPFALFSEESMHEYLSFNAQLDAEKETVLKVEHVSSEVVTVFAVQTQLLNWLLGLYPASVLSAVHQSCAIIEGVLKEATKIRNSPLYVYIDRFKLHIVACNDGKLVYYNQFAVKHFEDYIRYIMLVMKSLQMNQQSSEVMLWGYIGKNSPHYHEFYKFINNVTFGDRPSFLRFGYMFDEVQEHHFLDTYSIQLLN